MSQLFKHTSPYSIFEWQNPFIDSRKEKLHKAIEAIEQRIEYIEEEEGALEECYILGETIDYYGCPIIGYVLKDEYKEELETIKAQKKELENQLNKLVYGN